MNAHKAQLQSDLCKAVVLLRALLNRKRYLASLPQTAQVSDALYECKASCAIMADRAHLIRDMIRRAAD